MRKLLILALFLAQASFAEDGQALYEKKCSTCHQKEGTGISHAFPPLAGSPVLLSDDETVLSVVFNGRGGMPSWLMFLNDQQVADILTYARSAWGNSAPPIEVASVKEHRPPMPVGMFPLGN